MSVHGRSTLYDADGNPKLQWVKEDVAVNPAEMVAQMADACKGIRPPSYIIRRPVEHLEEALAFYPISDLHMGMYCWGKETGKNWDLKIAEEELNDANDRLLSRTPDTRYACLLGGGDALHADNGDNETARGKNKLDVDGRYGKVLDATCRFFVRRVDAALLKHDHVDVRILPGNHDEHSSQALAHFLAAWYRSDPRCTVNTDPSAFWFYRYGTTFLAATHGHKARAAQLPGIMAARRSAIWGTSQFRYAHTFHLHRGEKLAGEAGGAVVEVHAVAIPQDAWSYEEGFLAQRKVQSIIYSPTEGETDRYTVNL
jgi:hypothetical protein